MSLADKTRKIRNELLPSTLQHAVGESIYYRRALSKSYQQVHTLEDLVHLPILYKNVMIENLEECLCNPQPDDVLTFTSGTSGHPLVIRKSPAEIEEMRKCVDLPHAKMDKLPMILETVGNYHGPPYLFTTKNTINVPASIETHLHWIHHFLSTSFDYPGIDSRISVIRSNPETMVSLTLYFLQKNIQPRDFAIKRIAVTGSHISDRWRAFLEEQWQATIVDGYSMSEFGGNAAVQCNMCGYQHFVLPILVPEILNPITKQPIEAGFGVMVLTSLYPFTQRQPFIRYWTDDLVECGPKCTRDDVGFRFKGRMSQALFLPDAEHIQPLIVPFDLHDVLDSLPDLKRPYPIMRGDEQQASENAHLVLSFETAEKALLLPVRYSLAELSPGKYVIRIEIGLSYVPDVYPERVQWMSEYIVSQLRARNLLLAEALDDKHVEFDIRFFPPYSSPANRF
jgi:phenylacetate-coenzyme A ligase PaaK-like adenylate-forming protein